MKEITIKLSGIKNLDSMEQLPNIITQLKGDFDNVEMWFHSELTDEMKEAIDTRESYDPQAIQDYLDNKTPNKVWIKY